MNHRFEDIGVGKILKFWPFIIALFSGGAWYQSAKANAELTAHLQLVSDDHAARITRVEEAVISLQKIVDWQDRHRR